MFLSIKNKNSSNSGDLDLNSNPHSNIVAEDSVKWNHLIVILLDSLKNLKDWQSKSTACTKVVVLLFLYYISLHKVAGLDIAVCYTGENNIQKKVDKIPFCKNIFILRKRVFL